MQSSWWMRDWRAPPGGRVCSRLAVLARRVRHAPVGQALDAQAKGGVPCGGRLPVRICVWNRWAGRALSVRLSAAQRVPDV